MIIPIYVINENIEFAKNPLLYSIGINECEYLYKLFNNQAIVVDKNTMDYIDLKYNSLPILYDNDYSLNPYGFVSIHNLKTLYEYSSRHSDNTFILSTLNEFYVGINRYSKVYVISNYSLNMMYSCEGTIPLDFSDWIGTDNPVYKDEKCKIYCMTNKSYILSLYSKTLNRPLYEYEKELILRVYESDCKEISIPSYFPIINI